MAQTRGKRATPSQRLRGVRAKLDAAAPAPELSASLLVRPSVEKVRFKWIVKHKGELPVVAGDTMATHWLVQLEAAYEPLSILDGQATEQGNVDNRAFGLGVPKAEISMVLASKAIADTFLVGRAYHSDFTPVTATLHALY